MAGGHCSRLAAAALCCIAVSCSLAAANRPHKHPQPPHQRQAVNDSDDVVEGAARHIQAHHAKQPVRHLFLCMQICVATDLRTMLQVVLPKATSLVRIKQDMSGDLNAALFLWCSMEPTNARQVPGDFMSSKPAACFSAQLELKCSAWLGTNTLVDTCHSDLEFNEWLPAVSCLKLLPLRCLWWQMACSIFAA